uniref:Uncharacterized protein n=1 Tax=Arundo donax TaxID=35708 RepID=A0A0A9HGK0_ARUDO
MPEGIKSPRIGALSGYMGILATITCQRDPYSVTCYQVYNNRRQHASHQLLNFPKGTVQG